MSAGRGTHGIRLWNAADGEPLGSLAGDDDHVTALAIDTSGRNLAIGHRDGSIRLRDLVIGTDHVFTDVHEAEVTSLTFSPSGRHLASVGLDKIIRYWDTTNVSAPQWTLSSSISVAFSPEGTHVATIGEDDTLLLWDLATCQMVATFRDTRVEPTTLSFHPGGICLAVGGVERTLTFWYPLEDRAETSAVDWNSSPISLAFDPTGKYLAIGMFSEDYPLLLWGVQPHRQLQIVPGNSDEGCYVVISPNGRYLACYATGNTASIELWEFSPE